MIEKNIAFRTLVLITTPKLADKATKELSSEGIPIEHRLSAFGTATSEIMDILGLGGIDKTVLFSIMPKPLAQRMLQKLSESLKLGTTDSGIAFTVPITGMNSSMIAILQGQGNTEQRKVGTTVSDMKYSIIAANVNRGYSNKVMDAAREAGASGGSVINSRRITDEAISSKWGLGSQEEKEIVLIVVNAENKVKIMKNINEKCGIYSEAKGMVFSIAIDEVAGL